MHALFRSPVLTISRSFKTNSVDSLLQDTGKKYCTSFVTGPAKIGHVGPKNLTTFRTFGSHNFLFQYSTATKISELVDNLFGFRTLLTEFK